MVDFAIFVILSLSAVTASPVVGPEVVGGENATLGEFPFMISLQVDGFHMCGGSFISNQWVLTAAHCVDIGTLDETNAEVYFDDVKFDNTTGQTVKVDSLFPHPNFTSVQTIYEELIRNDIALLKLEHPVNFSSTVQPIKLPKQDQTVPVNQSATLIGWGMVNSQYQYLDDLQKVNLTIFDYPYCDFYNGNKNFSNVQNICAGDEDNTKGQCTGDSGGPLFIDDVQWGIVSWSTKPCISAPGVFTRTSVFIDWINSVIASN